MARSKHQNGVGSVVNTEEHLRNHRRMRCGLHVGDKCDNTHFDRILNCIHSNITVEEMAKANASRIWGPELFNDGEFSGFVHGPNLCASKDHCRCPRMDISKSTHKCFGCKKPLHSSICAKWYVESGKMWCVFCKKPNPEPQDLMENRELRDYCQRVGMG